MRLLLTQICTEGTQARAQVDQTTIQEYAQAMQEGHHFPPVVVFYDGSSYWLSDGFHRLEASRLAGFRDIEVELKLGTKRNAILYAVGANATHGLRRTPADKHQAVKLLLEDGEWGKWSDRAIARATVTSHPFVAKVRASLTGNISSERIYTTKYGTQALMNTSQIGKSRKSSEKGYTLQLQPNLWQRLQQYQKQLGTDSLDATLAKLLDLPDETIDNPVPQTKSTTRRWLGIDPGLAMVRWAILEGEEDNYDPKLLDYGTIQTAKKRPTTAYAGLRSERLWELEQDLVELLREFKPTDVALETPIINSDNPQNMRTVLEAVGVIHLVCYREGGIVPVHLYPGMWKGHLGNGWADNEEVTETIAAIFDLGEMGKTRLDAIGIAYAGFCGVAVHV